MKNQILAALLCRAMIAVSCKKESSNPSPGNGDIVYIAGYQTDSVTGRTNSTVWKNGIATTNALAGSNHHYAYAIAVNGNDVYTAGFENQPSIWKCQVWKNGQHQYSLGDTYTHGNGIAVSGSDVIVAGRAYENPPLASYAIIWRNSSNVSILAFTNSSSTGCSAVMASGTDMYAAGSVNGEAKLWKNGTEQPLTNPSIPSTSVEVVGIDVEGTDVYVVGYGSGTNFRVWKNGIPTDINTNGEGYPTSIAVSGTDVYVGGYEKVAGKWVATYWKNGTAIHIGDASRHSFVRGMAIKGTTVYATGEQRDANNISDYAALWTNGSLSIIGKRNSGAKAIVVK
jgi:hypothetical protein